MYGVLLTGVYLPKRCHACYIGILYKKSNSPHKNTM